MKPTVYVVMGVAGSGKTRIGAAFAHALGVTFIDGDDYHSAENRRRMANGIALTDDDRRQWLDTLAAEIARYTKSGESLVLACSALKRKYRDVLRGAGTVQLVFLRGSRDVIARRLAARKGHFMPIGLLESQFSTLEEPTPDEGAWVCDVRETPDAIVASLMRLVERSRT